MSAADPLAVTEHVPDGRSAAAPLVVLVHGSLDRSASFARVLRRLDDLHTVVYDRRGYHRSREALPLNTTLDGHVDDLLAVIDGRPPWWSATATAATSPSVPRSGAGPRTRSVAVAAYEPPMPWLDLWPTRPTVRPTARPEPGRPAERRRRGRRGAVLPPDGRRRGLGPAARDGQGGHGGPTAPALAAELAAIRITEPPFDVAALAVPGRCAAGVSNSAPRHRQSVAWLVEHTPGAELVEIRRRGPRRPPDPPRRLRRLRPPGARPGDRAREPAAGTDDMNVLVTGSSGLIGTALVERLAADGHTVTRLVRGPAARTAGHRASPRWHGTRPRGTIDAAGLRAGRTLRRRGPPGRRRHRRPTVVARPARSSILDSRTRSTRCWSTHCSGCPAAGRSWSVPRPSASTATGGTRS